MFTPDCTPTRGSSYDDADAEDSSGEEKEVSWTAAVVIIILAVGIGIIVTPYNLFQLWRHTREGGRHG